MSILNNYRLFFIYWFVLLLSTAAIAQTSSQINAIVQDEMDRQDIVGLAVGIIKNGRIHYAKGYGHNDLQGKHPVTTQTVFRWASVSKVLTATAVLRLARKHPYFSLNDRVAEHVNYWPRYGDKGDIRIGDLLSHRSGIIHYRTKNDCFYNRRPDYYLYRHRSWYYNARQGVDIFRNQDLCFYPGTDFKYSTFGYNLLGSAIEGATGKSYAGWINHSIRKPLGMTSLRQATGSRTGYDRKRGHIVPVKDGNVAWRLPGGGWESNIVDLAKFANALLQGRLLHNTSRLWSSVPGNRLYGFGMMHAYNDRLVWHEGSQVNNRALLVLFPKSGEQLGIVLLTNSAHSNLETLAYHLAELFTKKGSSQSGIIN